MTSIKHFFKEWGFQPLSIRGLTYLSLLMAIEIILAKIQIGPSFLKVGLTFIPIAFIAWWFGPFWGIISAIIVDPIQSFLNGYGFFIGFTLSAVVAILIYSLIFYRHDKVNIWRIVLAVLLVTIIVNICMDTLWTIILANAWTKTQFLTIFYPRIIKNIIIPPLEMVILWILMTNKALRSFKTNVFK